MTTSLVALVTFPLPTAVVGVTKRGCVLAAMALLLGNGCGDGVGRPILRGSSVGGAPALSAEFGGGGATSWGYAGVVGSLAGSATLQSTVGAPGAGSWAGALPSLSAAGRPSTALGNGSSGVSTTLSVTGFGGAVTTVFLIVAGGTPASTSGSGTDGPQASCGSTDSHAVESLRSEDNLATYINLIRAAGVPCRSDGETVVAPTLATSESLRCAARQHSQSAFEQGGAAQIIRDSGLAESQIAEIEVTTDRTKTAEDVLVDLLLDERRCRQLFGADYAEIGIGYAADRDSGYWTILLTQ